MIWRLWSAAVIEIYFELAFFPIGLELYVIEKVLFWML